MRFLATRTKAKKHAEGRVSRFLEHRTQRVPSDLFLWAALASIGTAFTLELAGREEKGHFVGQWVAPFLLLGLYNRIVKAGSHHH